MKCSIAKDIMLRQADGEDINTDIQKSVNAHVAQCKSCKQWQAYHQVIVDGPSWEQVAPFVLSPKVQQGIRDSAPVRVGWQLPQLSSPIWAASAACATLIAIVGVFWFFFASGIQVEPFRINGQDYRVVWLEKSAPFDPADVDTSPPPALQGNRRGKEGLLRYQLGFLTEDLAKALRKSLKSENWEAVRQALAAQEMELPIQPPKHLVISEELIELLETDVRGVELWVIQPTAGMLQFR